MEREKAAKKGFEKSGNFAKIAKATRIFLAMCKHWVTNTAKIAIRIKYLKEFLQFLQRLQTFLGPSCPYFFLSLEFGENYHSCYFCDIYYYVFLASKKSPCYFCDFFHIFGLFGALLGLFSFLVFNLVTFVILAIFAILVTWCF